jgi:hypothetical protein
LVRPFKISADWDSTKLVAVVAGTPSTNGGRLTAAMIPAELTGMLFTAAGTNDGGLRVATIPAELTGMLFTAAGTNDGGLIVATIPAELTGMLFTAAGTNGGGLIVATIPAELTGMLFTASSTNGDGGLIVPTIPAELIIMLSTAFDGDNPRIWSFLEPLRPALSLPLMVVATRAATAKHATRILRGVIEKVMVERSGDVKTIESINYGYKHKSICSSTVGDSGTANASLVFPRPINDLQQKDSRFVMYIVYVHDESGGAGASEQ